MRFNSHATNECVTNTAINPLTTTGRIRPNSVMLFVRQTILMQSLKG